MADKEVRTGKQEQAGQRGSKIPAGTISNGGPRPNQNPTKNKASHAEGKVRRFLQRLKNPFQSYKFRQLRTHPKAWIELIALVTVIAYTYYARKTFKEIGKQTPEILKSANAAKSAADTAASQLELAERPWVIADIAINGPLTFGEDGVQMSFVIQLKNIGHSPAIRTDDSIELFPILGPNDAIPAREQVCEQQKRVSALASNTPFARTIFPGIPTPPEPWSVPIPKEQVDLTLNRFGFLSASVIFCVAYRSGFSNSQYSTSYIYDVRRNDPTDPLLRYAITPKTKEIPAQYLILQLRQRGGVHAE
jgi:hypothetical protein